MKDMCLNKINLVLNQKDQFLNVAAFSEGKIFHSNRYMSRNDWEKNSHHPIQEKTKDHPFDMTCQFLHPLGIQQIFQEIHLFQLQILILQI